MKTTFRQRNNARTPSRKRLLYIFLVTILLVGVFSYLRPLVVSSASSVWDVRDSIVKGFLNLTASIREKSDLAEENRALREKLSSYDNLVISYRALESSFESLLSNFGRESSSGVVASAVIARPPKTPYDILILDAGSNLGVSVGDIVSLPYGGVLGRISEVFPEQAKVELFSSSRLETDAVLERGEIGLTLLGEGGGVFRTTIPRDVPVEVGDRVLFPGIRSEPIGVVSLVELASTDSEQKILIRGVANISQVRFVIIR